MSNIEREPSGAPEPWLKLEHVPDPPPLDQGPLAALHWKQEAERIAAERCEGRTMSADTHRTDAEVLGDELRRLADEAQEWARRAAAEVGNREMMRRERDEARQQLGGAVEALRVYGQHKAECVYPDNPERCTCGLTQSLTLLGGQ